MLQTLPVPSKTAIVVEFPGYISDLAAALETLGGSKAVTAAVHGQVPCLQCTLRPKEPGARPAVSEKAAARGLLLRLSRKRGEEEGELQMAVVARVAEAFRFSAPADLQVDSSDPPPPVVQVFIVCISSVLFRLE